MGFEPVRRIGRIWDDAEELNRIIKNFPFHTTGKTERDFENGFSTTLMAMQNRFENEVITQIDKTKKVESVYCFGKNNRPDLTLAYNGIAIEIKFITYGGLCDAIGQGYLYRVRYKFVFIILVISEDQKDLYYSIYNKEEKDLKDVLLHLSLNMNIFTYIVPAFEVKLPGVKKCMSFFK